MKLRILIKTPPGQAEGTERKLRTFLLGMKKPSDTGYKNDCFYWELDVGAREFVKYQKKIYMFSSLASGVVGNKVFKGAAQRLGATKEQLTEVEHMLMDGTEIEIIKAATAEEIVEANKTWWQKFKEEFKNN